MSIDTRPGEIAADPQLAHTPAPSSPSSPSDSGPILGTSPSRRRHLRVGMVATTDAWRSDLQAYLEHHVDQVDPFVIRDPHLLDDEHLDLVLVDDACTVIGTAELALLERRRVPVIGLFHTDGSGRGEEHLVNLGVRRRIAATVDVIDLARIIRSFDPRPVAEPSAPPRSPMPASAHGSHESERHVDQVLSPAWVVAIGGTSDRRHELAALLAAGYGRTHQSLVVDLDPHRPRLARRFRLQLQPNVLVACRSVGDEFDPMSFIGRRTVSAVELPFWTLVGVPSPETASQLDPDDLRQVISQMADVWPRIVLVTDAVSGAPAALSMRSAALAQSTAVAVAADPTPEGVLECLDWIVQTDAVDRHRVVDVVFCGRPADRARRLEIADQLRTHRPDGTIRNVVFLPWAERRIIAASWEGRHLARRSSTARAARRYAALVSDGTTKRLEIL